MLAISKLEIFGTLYYPPRPVSPLDQFDFYEMQPLDGIITHLTSQCGGNVHKKKVVIVTASSTSEGEPKGLVDFTADSTFSTKDKPNSWIRYDFKRWRVCPNAYTFMIEASSSPKSWVLEVSNDGDSWEVIDRRDENEDAKNYYLVHFPIDAQPHEYRYVRFRQTAPNHNNNDKLVIKALEIFGTICE